jgi:importin-5
LFLSAQEMINSLEQVATMISNSLQDLHPRVRLAAVNAVRMLSADLAPTLQAQYHHKMLPALNAVIEDFQFPLIQVYYF